MANHNGFDIGSWSIDVVSGDTIMSRLFIEVFKKFKISSAHRFSALVSDYIGYKVKRDGKSKPKPAQVLNDITNPRKTVKVFFDLIIGMLSPSGLQFSVSVTRDSFSETVWCDIDPNLLKKSVTKKRVYTEDIIAILKEDIDIDSGDKVLAMISRKLLLINFENDKDLMKAIDNHARVVKKNKVGMTKTPLINALLNESMTVSIFLEIVVRFLGYEKMTLSLKVSNHGREVLSTSTIKFK